MRAERAVYAAAAAFVLALTAASACTDFEAPEPMILPDVAVAEPSFSRDIQPIFTARCATAGCHTVATHQHGLVLEEGHAYEEIIDAPAVTGPGLPQVKPGFADSSWIVRAVEADDARRPGLVRMPLGRTPLTPNQIQTIRNWIDRGAVEN